MSHPYLFLVGAGPANPDLTTLQAVRIINSADVILYDALANDALLKYVSPNCIKRFVVNDMDVIPFPKPSGPQNKFLETRSQS